MNESITKEQKIISGVKRNIPTIHGLGLVLLIFAVMVVSYFLWSKQDLEPTPLITVERTKKLVKVAVQVYHALVLQ